MKASLKAPMELFGVNVVPKSAWPYPYVGAGGRYVTVRLDTKLNTTQTHVQSSYVDQIVEKIRKGEKTKNVEIVFVGGKTWIVDGHHTLAAHRLLGRPAPAFLYTPSGPDRLDAPKLKTRKKG